MVKGDSKIPFRGHRVTLRAATEKEGGRGPPTRGAGNCATGVRDPGARARHPADAAARALRTNRSRGPGRVGVRRGAPGDERCFNSPVTDYDVLRVFCAPNGGYGNELGVVREGSVLPDREDRQDLAAKLGFGETVFVDDPERGIIDVYTPTRRLPFADHSCVGVAWLLDVPELVTPAGAVGTRLDGEFTWIEARAEWAPPCVFRQYATAAEVDDLPCRRPARQARPSSRRARFPGPSTPGPGRTSRPAGSAPAASPRARVSTRTRRRARRRSCSPSGSAAP